MTSTPQPGSANILMAGVGGQGVLIASETLALAALTAGLEAKQSEVHGVAQRGGSVVSHVRFGPRIHSPLIRCGEVDVLCAGEQLEALRYAHYVRPGGPLIIGDRIIEPIRLSADGGTPYPSDVAGFLRGKGYEVITVPATATAIEIGDKRCANVVLLGVLSTCLDLPETAWRAAVERRFPAASREMNLKAFEAGRRHRRS